MSDLEGLQKRLRYISAQYEQCRRRAKADEVPVSDSAKRLALRQSLAAVILHLKAQPDFQSGDIAQLSKLDIALLDTEQGNHVSYLSPAPGGRPPPKTGIAARRAVAAAHVSWLMQRGDTKGQASRVVFRKVAKGLFGKKQQATPRSIERWRDDILSLPMTDPVRLVYEEALLRGFK